MVALAASPAVTLSAPGPLTPALVGDGRSLLATWVDRPTNGDPRLLARDWSPGRPVAAPRRVAAGDTLLDLDSRAGDAVAVYGRSWGESDATLLTTTRHAGAWRSPVVLMRRRGSWYPRSAAAAVSARGVSVVAGIRQHPVQASQLRVRESGGDLASPRSVLLDRSPQLDAPALAAADDGSLAMAWESSGLVRLATRTADGDWSAPVTVATRGQLVALVSRPGAGAPLLVWTAFDRAEVASYSATVGPDGALTARRRLPGVVDRGAAALGPGGRAVVTWLVHGGRRGRTVLVRAVARAPSGRWRSSVTLSRPWRIPAPGGQPVAAYAADGRVVVAWSRLGIAEARILSQGGWSATRTLIGWRSAPAIVPAAAAVGRRLVVATTWPAAGGGGTLRAWVLR